MYSNRSRFIGLLIFLNVLVFGMWLSVSFGYFSEFVDAKFMEQNFLVSWNGLLEGRYWILLTSAFSHILGLHIFLNMFVLQSFGPIVQATIGVKRFFDLLFCSGHIFFAFPRRRLGLSHRKARNGRAWCIRRCLWCNHFVFADVSNTEDSVVWLYPRTRRNWRTDFHRTRYLGTMGPNRWRRTSNRSRRAPGWRRGSGFLFYISKDRGQTTTPSREELKPAE